MDGSNDVFRKILSSHHFAFEVKKVAKAEKSVEAWPTQVNREKIVCIVTLTTNHSIGLFPKMVSDSCKLLKLLIRWNFEN